MLVNQLVSYLVSRKIVLTAHGIMDPQVPRFLPQNITQLVETDAIQFMLVYLFPLAAYKMPPPHFFLPHFHLTSLQSF